MQLRLLVDTHLHILTYTYLLEARLYIHDKALNRSNNTEGLHKVAFKRDVKTRPIAFGIKKYLG